MFARSQRPFSLNTFLSFGDIDKNVQSHLRNVYATLSIGLILSCIGAYAFLVSPTLQAHLTLLLILSLVGSIGSTLYVYFTPHTRENVNSRLLAFFILAAVTGIGLGPLIQVISVLHPETIPTALLGTAVIFVSFSLAAILTKKRYYLFLGAAIMSATSILASFSLMNIFIRSPMIYRAELYVGFAIFCAFVIFDTQLIVEKRRYGDTDFIAHTMDLFVDFIEIFRHLLIILNSKRSRRDDDE